MSSFLLLLPGDRNVRAAVQAEVERAIAACAAQTISGRAREVLARAGHGNSLRPRDGLEVKDEQA